MTQDIAARRRPFWVRLKPAWLSRAELSRAEPRERLPVPHDPQRLAEVLRTFAAAATALADELER